jgi:hypothetical protein
LSGVRCRPSGCRCDWQRRVDRPAARGLRVGREIHRRQLVDLVLREAHGTGLIAPELLKTQRHCHQLRHRDESDGAHHHRDDRFDQRETAFVVRQRGVRCSTSLKGPY